MSVIFYTTFAKNIDRIENANHRSNSATREPSARDFAEVLADLEKGSTTEGDSPADPSPAIPEVVEGSRAVPLPLSNLTLGERATAPTIKTAVKSVIPSVTPASFLKPKSETTQGLKGSALNPIPSQPTLPKAPDIIEAKRIAIPNPPPKPLLLTGLSGAEFHNFINDSGRKHGVDPLLGMAVARAESNFNPQAVSRDGHASKGLFQLLDATGKEMMDRMGVQGTYQPFNAKQNTHLGMGYLRRLHNLFSDQKILVGSLRTHPASSAADLEKLAVAAFNAGEGNVARAQAKAKARGKDPGDYTAVKPHLPAITQAYVERVLTTKLALAGTSSDIETV